MPLFRTRKKPLTVTMPGPITIRNLTAQPLTVDSVERYEAPSPEKFPPNAGVSSLASNFTGLMSNVTGGGDQKKSQPKRGQVGEHAKSIKKEDVNVPLEPFKVQKTDINSGPKDQVVRLTFREEGAGKYRVDLPTDSGTSTKLTPLGPGSKQEFTAIYNENDHFLAIFESTTLNKWMKGLADDTPLSALSIPGTHNSPTCHNALPSVRCQAVTPTEQLENGVRFFDVRVQVNNPNDEKSDDLELVHSVFPISLTGPKKFKGLLDQVLEFLQKNPSETVIMSLKREGRGDAKDSQFADRLKEHYVDQHWHTDSGIPTLGEVRGKITLMRRFGLSDKIKKQSDHKGWGIDATNWADNTPDHRGGPIQVQDFYEVTDTENIDKKSKLVCEHLERAAEAEPFSAASGRGPGAPIFINFMSASNFWKPGCWPDKIAAKLNPAATNFLCEKHDVSDKGDGGTGILVCDWVGENGDWDLVRCVVGMNSRLLLKQRGGAPAAAGAESQAMGGQNDGGEEEDEGDEEGGEGEGRRGGRGGGRGRGGRGRGGRGRGHRED